ncbi:MAG: FGGY family carbohydrate kinase [Balneolaceae bacterium]|nr:FGGY family carbohydrate kinase [Balneolaceae bacterium]
MPSHKPVTAIFDIGKSNKKFLLFDEDYAVIEKHQTKLEQTVDDDGDPCEDLERLETWIKFQFQKAQKKYEIQALNFSAYGASFVHIDKNGQPVTPLYNYLKNFPEELLDQFYKSVGGREKFALETASPPMGMLNSGLQLYWLKYQKPEIFKKIKNSLHLPNYLSYLFTGKSISELTSIGCHTGLWNFDEMDYHSWVRKEKVQSLLPNPQPVTEIVEKNGVKIGPGIHDSSAALAPYLIGLNDLFMLISTGTWSITLNPFNDEPLTFKELEKDCLCYLDIFGNQVKASRLFLGAEYSHQKKKIYQHFSVNDKGPWMNSDVDLLNRLIETQKNEKRLELEEAYNSGPFPQKKAGDWQLDHFSSAKEAYHQLMLDLVSIQAESIKLAEGSKNIDKLIVTGGFSQNDLFVSLLASFFPDRNIYTAKLSDASALGAAMVVNNMAVHLEQKEKLKTLLGFKRHWPIKRLTKK